MNYSDFFDIPVELNCASENIFDIFLPEIITRATKKRTFSLVFGNKKTFLIGYRACKNFSFRDVFHAAKSFSKEIPSGLFPEQWKKEGTALCEICKFENTEMKILCQNMKTLGENLKSAILENQETNCLFFTDYSEEKIFYSFIFFRLDNSRPDISSLKQAIGENHFQNRIFSKKKLKNLENPFFRDEEKNDLFTEQKTENCQKYIGKYEKIESNDKDATSICNIQKDSKYDFEDSITKQENDFFMPAEIEEILKNLSTEQNINETQRKRTAELIETGNFLLERQETCAMILLSLASEESIFLFGPPGTAKSMSAKWAASLLQTEKIFSCLLNQYTQPEELFGPVSIRDLENGSYKRLCEGYLPESEIIFLDEIWKAGPAILNTLLTICNEKNFKNGNDTQTVPMKLLISASNELPSEDSGLEPLYDRFLIRLSIEPLSKKENFFTLLKSNKSESHVINPITEEELLLWKKDAQNILASQNELNIFWSIRLEFQKEEIYISDRRWKKSFEIMKTCAFLNGRKNIDLSDFLVLCKTLWNFPEEIQKVQNIIAKKLIENQISSLRKRLSANNFTKIFTASAFEKLKTSIIQIFLNNIFASKDFIDECESELESQSIKNAMESFEENML